VNFEIFKSKIFKILSRMVADEDDFTNTRKTGFFLALQN
jgi:hypothetical protein